MGKRPPYRRSSSKQPENTMSNSTRLSLAAIAAAVTVTLALPSAGLAFQGGPGVVKSAPKAPSAGKHKPINTNVCTPGRPGFNPNKCLDDITTKPKK
jgi:hypothetical protein